MALCGQRLLGMSLPARRMVAATHTLTHTLAHTHARPHTSTHRAAHTLSCAHPHYTPTAPGATRNNALTNRIFPGISSGIIPFCSPRVPRVCACVCVCVRAYSDASTGDSTHTHSATSATSATSGGTATPASSGVVALSNLIDVDDSLSQITSYDAYGFTINRIHMRGSVLVFRNYTLLWDVQAVERVAPRNLAPVHMVRPRVTLLIVGTGDKYRNVNPALYAYMQRKGIALEVMDTAHAIAAFNVLNAEGRAVAAAMISRTPVSRDEACLYTHDAQATAADKRIQQALARPSALSAGPDARQLLTDGRPDPGAVAMQEIEDESRRRAAAAEEAAAASRAAAERSKALEVQYGYPGAQAPDVSLVDRERAAAARERTRQMRSSAREDLERSLSERNMRRSGAPGKT